MKEYTRLEYIESDGNQWIDTGVSGGVNAAYSIKFNRLNIVRNYEQYFGGDQPPSSMAKIFADKGDTTIVRVSHQVGSNLYEQMLSFPLNSVHQIDVDSDGYIYFDGIKQSVTTITSQIAGKGWGTNTWWVCGHHGEPELLSSMRLYSLKMWTDGTLIRDYIPVKNSEGICGLYDQVEKMFYSSQGSKDFIGGAEIEDKPLSFPYGFRRRLMNEMYLTKITTIRINQNLTDPSTMITRIVDEGGIEAIRANSHRYVGVFDSATNLMSLRQLDDNDGTKYLDGTTAPITTLGNDVWMKLPQFFYKAEEYETDVWDISFAYGNKPDDTFKEWDGKDLIGVYKACSSSSKMYSTSGKAAIALSYNNAVSYSKNRGAGFSGMRWRYHCMFSFLFWAYYGTTYSTNVCGVPPSSYKLTTGVNDSLGMNDTSSGTNIRVNFWGMEDYWGNMREYVIDTSASYSNKKFTVSNLDGTTSTYTDPYPSLYIVNKITITENLEFYPKTKSSTRTLFGDNFGAWNNSSDQTLTRTYPGGENTGVANIGFWVKGWSPDNGSGARLTYRGDYIITD